MLSNSTLNIYESSAGSGKTYSLVKEYLCLILSSDNPYIFKNILVVTFTNKASYEIKTRILESLQDLSNPEKSYYHPLFFSLLKELNFLPIQLINKSNIVLKSILHKFSDFSISTIDKFFYKIISFFSHNFNFINNFELKIESNSLLKEAINRVISKLSPKSLMSIFLVEFSFEKLQKGISWDPSFEFLKFSSILLKEENFIPLEKLKKHKFSDFICLKNYLTNKVIFFEKNLTIKAKNEFSFFKEKNILPSYFYYNDWPNSLKKLIEGKYIINPFGKRLRKNMFLGKLYSKSCKDFFQKKLFDIYSKEILEHYNCILNFYEKNFLEYLISNILLKNISSLAFLYEIEKELFSLKKEKNFLFIEEINLYINKWINQEFVSFISKKLGEYYTHYFIDEFQDTSLIQWKNLKPFIQDALFNNGSVMIVGDIKQSLYRWRGAYPEQFFSLCKDDQFSCHKKVYYLKKNFRSLNNIIHFNNELYYSAAKFLSKSFYKKIYCKSIQEFGNKNGGYIEINFIPSIDKNIYYSKTCKKIQDRIKNLLLQGYKYRDICLLVRNKKQGSFLSEFFINIQWPIISSESLLLKNSWKVKIVLGYLKILLKPEDINLRIDWLLLLFQHDLLKSKLDFHFFIQILIKLSFKDFFKKLKKEGLYFKGYLNYNYSLYELCEEVIRVTKLNILEESAEIHFFLNLVHNAMNKEIFTLSEFFEFWNEKKNKERIIFPESLNALNIMTIHQSKGLQFPIVILAFADWKAFEEKKGNLWLKVDPKKYKGFDLLYININNSMKFLKGKFKKCYEDYLSKIQFDNLNLLYVATTRSIEQLFIFSRQSKFQNSTIAFYLENYLKIKSYWNSSKNNYKIGISIKN